MAFLDRDGTINVDRGYVHKIEDWEWALGAIEGLQSFQKAGFALVIITNQTAIAQGMYTEEAMHVLHQYMESELEKNGIHLAAVLYCPHGRDSACDCRKPNIGMANQAEKIIGPIDYKNSWTIGDKVLDFMFGKKLGTKTALVRSAYWKEADLAEQPDYVVGSLSEAADKIILLEARN